MEAASKVGKGVINREDDTESAFHSFLKLLMNKGGDLRFEC